MKTNVKVFGLTVGVLIASLGYVISILIAYAFLHSKIDLYRISYLTIVPYIMLGGGTVIIYAARLGMRSKIRYQDDPYDDYPIGEVPSISIIIPMRNKVGVIYKVIEGIAKQTFPSDKIEVVVIDDGSTDESYNMLKKAIDAHKNEIKNFIIIRNTNSLGRLNALKQGFKRSKGDIILFLDADTVLDVDFDRGLHEFISKLQMKGVGGVLGNLEPVCGERLVCYMQKIMYATGLSLGREVDTFLGRPVIILSGAFSSYRREVLDKVLDSVKLEGAEDFELTLLTARLGFKTVYTPKAKALTDAPFTWKDLYHQQFRWFKGGFMLILKYFKDIIRGLRDKGNEVWRSYSKGMILYIIEEYVLPSLQFIGYISLLYSLLTMSSTLLLIMLSAFLGSVVAGITTLSFSLNLIGISRYVRYTPIFVTIFIPFLAVVKVTAMFSHLFKGGSVKWKDVASHRMVS